MQFLTTLGLLAVAATASPLQHDLTERAASCSLGKTTALLPSPGTLAGPFTIQARSTSTLVNGNKASLHQNVPGSEYKFLLTFDPKPPVTHLEFYLSDSGSLLVNATGSLETVFEYFPSDQLGYLSIAPTSTSNVACTLEKTSCTLDCKVGSGKYNCLANPKYQPDWRIVADKKAAGLACLAFTPKVLPL